MVASSPGPKGDGGTPRESRKTPAVRRGTGASIHRFEMSSGRIDMGHEPCHVDLDCDGSGLGLPFANVCYQGYCTSIGCSEDVEMSGLVLDVAGTWSKQQRDDPSVAVYRGQGDREQFIFNFFPSRIAMNSKKRRETVAIVATTSTAGRLQGWRLRSVPAWSGRRTRLTPRRLG